MSPWLKTVPLLAPKMSEDRRTHSPQRIEALKRFLKLSNNPAGEDLAETILGNPDPWVREVLLLDCIQEGVFSFEQLQRQVSANQPQPYIHDASGGGFPIGNPDLFYGSPGDD